MPEETWQVFMCAEGLGPQKQASGNLCLLRGRTKTQVAEPLPCCVPWNKSGPSLVSSPHCSHQLWIPKNIGNREKGKEPQKMTSGKIIFYSIYIYIVRCKYNWTSLLNSWKLTQYFKSAILQLLKKKKTSGPLWNYLLYKHFTALAIFQVLFKALCKYFNLCIKPVR